MESQGLERLSIDVLFALVPATPTARQILEENKANIFEVIDEYGQLKECLTISLRKPTIGRDKNCGIWLSGLKYSRKHCEFRINPSSGELVLHKLTKLNNVVVDGHSLIIPTQVAFVFSKAEALTLGDATFKVIWPPIPKTRLREYRQLKREAAEAMLSRLDPDLTDNEMIGSVSLPITRRPTAFPSRATTPMSTQYRPPFVLERLGKGEFGVVHLAVDRYTADFVAVKRIPLSTGGKSNLREIEILSRLKHRNIVRILGWQQIDEECAIDLVLEYCPSGSLADVLHEEWVQVQARSIFMQLCDGLQYLHEQAIVHRDIKPANILLIREPDQIATVKLGDFGLATRVAQARTYCGSPTYMAPEVMKGQLQTSKIDIYSLGVVILELTGCLRGMMSNLRINSLIDIVTAISTRAQDFYKDDRNADLLRSMILRDPARRPTAAECLGILRGAERLPRELPRSTPLDLQDIFKQNAVQPATRRQSSRLNKIESNRPIAPRITSRPLTRAANRNMGMATRQWS